MPPTTLLDRLLDTGAALHVAADGQMSFGMARPSGLLPGSFNPLHGAHCELARVAGQILGQPVAFELSVVNVDKPPLAPAEVRRRLSQFAWRAPVWLTRACHFVDKAEHFPSATFVVGADTALRIVLPRYYHDDEARMGAALARIRDLDCRFLVACRADGSGQYLQRDDLPIPRLHRDLFQAIPSRDFRWDLSSTDLRSRGW